MDYFGHHLILDCKAGLIDKITDRAAIVDFTKRLVGAIDMIAYGEPIVEHFAAHNPHAAGFSLVQLIETSSITGHFVDQSGDFYLDIFSCKPFDPAVAKEMVMQAFHPQNIAETFLSRRA